MIELWRIWWLQYLLSSKVTDTNASGKVVSSVYQHNRQAESK